MPYIAYLDLEIDTHTKKIMDIGAVFADKNLHTAKISEIINQIKDADFICGHNFLNHDYTYIQSDLQSINKNPTDIIDTLYLSALLFPKRPYHALNKDYKTDFENSNNPLNDCMIIRELLEQEIIAFHQLSENLKIIFYQLLKEKAGFAPFFKIVNFNQECSSIVTLIKNHFQHKICEHSILNEFIQKYPIGLCHVLALIECDERHSINPSWVLYKHPEIEYIFNELRATPCHKSCVYCDEKLNAKKALGKYFGYDDFRSYDDKPLQAQAVQSAINGESLLAVFPTGGGKSITFQIPALMAGENKKGLTVIISPLQSLMKDQVDNLESRGITEAVTINGLLDPIERQKAITRIKDGTASLLYISPESLRSRTIENLIASRTVARFVIDEAHCFSAWGQDFRVDYLYIGEFINRIQSQKMVGLNIPVSCFTATAKPQVILDIKHYFKEQLDLELKLFSASVERKNLQYQVIPQNNEEQKYQTLRELIQIYDCPTIIYVSRTKKTAEIATQLSQDGFNALPYHGKMDSELKIFNQNSFITGETQIMVATSAFGMGVDKKDVGLVVHFEISDSLENYVQEAGRAGRDENIQAKCYVLFSNDDLDKHFILLNQTKISQKEIGQIWRALKEKFAKNKAMSISALEIARQAGWNDEINDIETRVTTAINALEESGYVKRGQNMPKVFANSILSPNTQTAIEKINNSTLIAFDDKQTAIRIIKKLFSQRSQRQLTDEQAESRVDYIADVLGLQTEKVVKLITLMRKEEILADQQDLQAYIPKNSRSYPIVNKINELYGIELLLLEQFQLGEGVLCTSLKALNHKFANQYHHDKISPKTIKSLLTFWKIKNWIKRAEESYQEINYELNHSYDNILAFMQNKKEKAIWLAGYLYQLAQAQNKEKSDKSNETLPVDFSLGELQSAFYNGQKSKISFDELEDALFYISRMGLIKIDGGFLVMYQRLHLTRLEMDNRKQYTKDDYKKLYHYYKTRREQIHIVGKYANLMTENQESALQLVNDYFSQEYQKFLKTYFKNSDVLNKNMTEQRFNEWFGNLSSEQLAIINDNQSQHMVVFATAGSGKTRVLVHKLASLYQMEDIKHEQLLMLTFSRAAAIEFKSRLVELLGNAGRFIEIKTFHSYCFDLLGRVGDLKDADKIIKQAIDKINKGEVEESRIAKLVLVIDEAQDMNKTQFELIQTLMAKNEEMRVIAVGDDDQTIYTFMGASPDYMGRLCDMGATRHYLTHNYRSQKHIVDFCNHFAKNIHNRLKSEEIIAVNNAQEKVKGVHYSGDVMPYLIEQVKQKILLGGSIGILTQTNEEAIYIAGQLRQHNLPCKLVQSNDGFKVKDLLEVRVFDHYLKIAEHQSLIDDTTWQSAKEKTNNERCKNSKNLFLLNNLINAFELANPNQKYVSDWRIFIEESRLENFYHVETGGIFVSTIHKAKGREYDSVFVYLDNPKYQTDDEKRVLYVAFSRAKQHLSILSNQKGLFELCQNIDMANYTHTKKEVKQLALYLTHEDVNLGHFKEKQELIKNCLNAGDALFANDTGVFYDQKQLFAFSKSKFIPKLGKYLKKGYYVIGSEINFIVLWYDKNTQKEYRIILPIIYLQSY
ncbi:RecQ family ATP-dependent DNA helicase [Moraxella bovis]|uniref:RecQ family ATP-dependent DNA helicase n=1 Tax=Moraxella bovis TaxID=476 RepID=UPI00223EF414|nr:RecQ family ATP-dependent DNA helicase [Moraxella bovis]UZA54268.1 RecQ family ATP-dependent DNA helicase [Moraxella bovis]